MRNKTELFKSEIQNNGRSHPERSRRAYLELAEGVCLQMSGTHRSRPDVSTPHCSARHDRWCVALERRAFTLIELLVVIAIIALLMAILMPALQRVKKQAKAVACQSNLHQWAVAFGMYAGDNDGYFWSGNYNRGGWENYAWLGPLRPYYSNEAEMRFCPTAVKLREEGARDPFAAWGPVEQTGDQSGSYGMNNWLCNPSPEVEFIHGREATKDNWRNAYVDGAANIPMFLDCAFVESKPYDFDTPPEYDGDISTYLVSALQMKRFCMNRHGEYANGVFLDFSVRKIGLKQLWTFKWHRSFDINNSWTTAGGVQPSDWPEWMRRFKDY